MSIDMIYVFPDLAMVEPTRIICVFILSLMQEEVPHQDDDDLREGRIVKRWPVLRLRECKLALNRMVNVNHI